MQNDFFGALCEEKISNFKNVFQNLILVTDVFRTEHNKYYFTSKLCMYVKNLYIFVSIFWKIYTTKHVSSGANVNFLWHWSYLLRDIFSRMYNRMWFSDFVFNQKICHNTEEPL